MLKRIFCFGKKNQNAAHETTGAVSVKSVPESVNSGDRSADLQVVPLRSPESEAALRKKKDPSELFNDAVNRLVDKLEGINGNLDRQVQQNEQLVARMDTLPELLGSLPEAVNRQQRIFDEIAGQIKQKAAQDEKTIAELSGIREKVSASVEMDAKMSENFGEFAKCLTKLDDDTLNQTEWLQHLNRSYSSSEEFLRESLRKQRVHFYVIFGVSLAISLLTISGLGVLLYLLLNRQA
jgi:regulator of replication initiation timing